MDISKGLYKALESMYHSEIEDAKVSMELSLRGAERCKINHSSSGALYGIIQGGVFKDLRDESID